MRSEASECGSLLPLLKTQSISRYSKDSLESDCKLPYSESFASLLQQPKQIAVVVGEKQAWSIFDRPGSGRGFHLRIGEELPGSKLSGSSV